MEQKPSRLPPRSCKKPPTVESEPTPSYARPLTRSAKKLTKPIEIIEVVKEPPRTIPSPSKIVSIQWTPRPRTCKTPVAVKPKVLPETTPNRIDSRKSSTYEKPWRQLPRSCKKPTTLDPGPVQEEQPVVEEKPKPSPKKSTPEKGGKLTVMDFERGRRLGKGAFGTVYLVRTKVGHFVCAMKVMAKHKFHDVEQQVEREIEIQSHLDHPNVIKLYTYFWNSDYIFLVMEYAPNGELYDLLLRERRFPEKAAARFLRDIVNAIIHCHSHHVIHRDIKPENLLIGVDGELKIADFGCSVHAPSDKRRTLCGTMDYNSPEMVRKEEHGVSVDLWALGCLAYEFLVGKPPFEYESHEETREAVKRGDFVFPDHVSNGPRDLISKLLVVDPSKRLSLEEVKTHYWIRMELEPRTRAEKKQQGLRIE